MGRDEERLEFLKNWNKIQNIKRMQNIKNRTITYFWVIFLRNNILYVLIIFVIVITSLLFNYKLFWKYSQKNRI